MDLRQKLDGKSQDLAELLPSNLPVAKFIRVVMAEAVRNPDLARCDFLSVYTALTTAAQLGLMVGSVLGECYLIPYGNTCQAIIGYKGLTKLARRAGVIVRAELVYQGEAFSYERGTGQITHPWRLDVDRAPEQIVAAYAAAEMTQFPNLRPIVVVLTRADIERHRAHDFWFDHVLAGVAPDPATAEDVNMRWARAVAGETKPAAPVMELLRRYEALGETERGAKKERDAVRTELLCYAGGAAALVAPDGRTPLMTLRTVDRAGYTVAASSARDVRLTKWWKQTWPVDNQKVQS